MAHVMGYAAALYVKANGQGGGGSWVELALAKEATVSMEAAVADVSTRASGAWKQEVAGRKSITVEAELLWDPADAGFAVVRDGFLNNAMIGVRALDGDYPTGTGPQGDFMVTQFSRKEPSGDDAISVSVTMKLTKSDTPPTWIGA